MLSSYFRNALIHPRTFSVKLLTSSYYYFFRCLLCLCSPANILPPSDNRFITPPLRVEFKRDGPWVGIQSKSGQSVVFQSFYLEWSVPVWIRKTQSQVFCWNCDRRVRCKPGGWRRWQSSCCSEKYLRMNPTQKPEMTGTQPWIWTACTLNLTWIEGLLLCSNMNYKLPFFFFHKQLWGGFPVFCIPS